MALWKSKEERRIERKIRINQTLGSLQAQIRRLEKDEAEFKQDALTAKRSELPKQEQIAKRALRGTIAKRRMLQQVYLSFKVLAREEEQMATYNQFASGMDTLAKSIGGLARNTNLAKAQTDFAKSLARAKGAEERMRAFIDSSSEILTGDLFGEDLESDMTDEDLDRIILGEAREDEAKEFDVEIEKGLEEIGKLRNQG